MIRRGGGHILVHGLAVGAPRPRPHGYGAALRGGPARDAYPWDRVSLGSRLGVQTARARTRIRSDR
eukprot:2324756-Pyramimonas_sp.AAC.1